MTDADIDMDETVDEVDIKGALIVLEFMLKRHSKLAGQLHCYWCGASQAYPCPDALAITKAIKHLNTHVVEPPTIPLPRLKTSTYKFGSRLYREVPGRYPNCPHNPDGHYYDWGNSLTCSTCEDEDA